jgi:hypothetical protein
MGEPKGSPSLMVPQRSFYDYHLFVIISPSLHSELTSGFQWFQRNRIHSAKEGFTRLIASQMVASYLRILCLPYRFIIHGRNLMGDTPYQETTQIRKFLRGEIRAGLVYVSIVVSVFHPVFPDQQFRMQVRLQPFCNRLWTNEAMTRNTALQ